MATVKDINRGMRRESESLEREERILEHDLWADKEGAMPKIDADEDDGRLEIMGANSPITINYGSPESEPSTPATAPPESTPEKPGMPTWAKYAAAAAVGAGGLLLYNALTDDSPPPTTVPLVATEHPAGLDRYLRITREVENPRDAAGNPITVPHVSERPE